MSASLLLEIFPSLAQRIPIVPLGEFPTPVHPSPEIARDLGIKELWIKRDDLSGQTYGGNKVRKLEFLFGQAKKHNCSHLVTMGATGSNHVVATAIYGRQEGFQVKAFLFPQPDNGYIQRNLQASQSMGAQLKLVSNFGTGLFRLVTSRRSDTFVIPPGGSSAWGVLGYVAAAWELKLQIERGDLPKPDIIYVALGSCGTAAGLWLGMQLSGIQTQIVAVRVVPRVLANMLNVKRLCYQTRKLLQRWGISLPCSFSQVSFDIDGSQLGQGYAFPTEAGKKAMDLVHFKAQIPLDPTYTGKTFAALVSSAQKREWKNKNVLFWNTYNFRKLPSLSSNPILL